MESYDVTSQADITQSIPQGLLEKNVGESQMAEFSTPLDEVVPQGAGMQMMNMMSGPPMQQAQQEPQPQVPSGRKIPFGLTHEQYMAVLAGLAAVVATSKPIQDRVFQFFPSIDAGSTSAMAVTAFLVALIFLLAHRFLI